ncbi:MAG: 4-diphosphocytidyl-2-C-methyl-D-erythritol kinase [Pseudomonadota bacterium]|jgi:4-diphosphocytidyl-2-C-methyl-D-erythritol kinase
MNGAAAPTIRVEAPPKINLSLRVLGRRQDGYHQIESLVAFAPGIGDWIQLSPGPDPVIEVTGPYAHRIVGTNILERVLTKLRTIAPAIDLGTVRLVKNLPVASGIGGGSSDAAALLNAIIRANPASMHDVDWHRLALELGADVPVCLSSRAAFMTGIGDVVRPLPRFPSVPAVLVVPDIAVPPDKTAQVFRRLAAPSLPEDYSAAPPDPPQLPSVDTVIDHVRRLRNDLLAPALSLFPEIAPVQDALSATSGCRVVRLSGAGPTSFALYGDFAAAKAAAQAIDDTHPDWWVAAAELA